MKSWEEVLEEQLRVNIVSLYGGYESEIPELAKAFGISEEQVKRYIREEEELMEKLYGDEKK